MAFLTVEHISKTFPGVRALDDVSVEFEKASVHAVMGENGAGKSTLGKIIARVYSADQGVSFGPNMTVAENLQLGGFPTKPGFMHCAKLREKARALLHEIGADIDV